MTLRKPLPLLESSVLPSAKSEEVILRAMLPLGAKDRPWELVPRHSERRIARGARPWALWSVSSVPDTVPDVQSAPGDG